MQKAGYKAAGLLLSIHGKNVKFQGPQTNTTVLIQIVLYLLVSIFTMSDPSVSDVDPDDLEQMIQGIDDIDDNLFGIKKDKSKLQPTKPTMS